GASRAGSGRGGERRYGSARTGDVRPASARTGERSGGRSTDRRTRRGAQAAGPAATSQRPRRIAPPPDPEKLIARQPWTLLRPMLADAPGGEDATLERLKKYALDLLRWNRG